MLLHLQCFFNVLKQDIVLAMLIFTHILKLEYLLIQFHTYMPINTFVMINEGPGVQ